MTQNDSPVWRQHSCCFYGTKQDLLDILVPFFKDGLERQESCLWLISDPLSAEDAKTALRQVVPDLDRYEATSNIEFLPYKEWYFKEAAFDAKRVIHGLRQKLGQAVARGHAGLRVSGDTGWVKEKNWRTLVDYENKLNGSLPDERMRVLCTYPIAASGARDLLDVAHAHQAVAARRNGNWEVLETAQFTQALEQIRSLAAANESLRSEIAERVRVENELKRLKEILQTIFDHIPVMIAFVDDQNRIKLVNPEWERTVGWTLEEIQRQNLDIVAECYPDPEYRQLVLNFLAESNGEWANFKPRLRDGRVIDTNWTVVRLSDGTSIGMGRDITDRQRAEEALRESEERFRQLAENIRELFWIKTPDFKHVIYLSPSYESFTGRDRETRYREDGFESFLEMIYPEDRAGMAEIIQRTDGQEFEIEFRISMPDGSLRWIHDHGFPIRDRSGQVYRIAGIAQNVTDRKLAEERLKATSEQLRALSASLQSAREEERTRIAREIHDELGSALTILKWDLEGLKKTFLAPVDQSHLGNLREKTTSMVNLTDTIIHAIRRIASELRPSILDDIGLVDAIEWQAQQFQARTGIVCHSGRTLETAHLNKEQSTAVFRIFQETLTNVLRHAQATKVDIAMHEQKGTFVLTIVDNGKGIANGEKPDQLSLGLLGMQERAHLVGGKVDIGGMKPNGTVVTVQVPTL
jgi:PAS domain S-box-containing protein